MMVVMVGGGVMAGQQQISTSDDTILPSSLQNQNRRSKIKNPVGESSHHNQ
jgi:hypothetical protein